MSIIILCRGGYLFATRLLATGLGETEILTAQSSLQQRVQHLQSDVKGHGPQIQSLSLKLNKQDQDISAIKEEVQQLLSELSETRIALTNIAEKL